MSRPQDPPRSFFPFGNPFRMLSPKGSDLSPWLLSLLNGFELNLAERLKKLIPKNKEEDILTLSWMKLAMESLCETHKNVNTLITDLQLPVADWEEKWVDVYLDISVKLLDLCNAFSSELTRVNQGDLFLKCVQHNLQSDSGEKYLQARSSLDSWKQHVNADNPRIETCRAVLDSLVKSLNFPKVKNSGKGKVLRQAFYGVKVQTVYICSVFTAAWSDSTKDLFDLPVSEKPLWAKTFTDLQNIVNTEIRDMLLSSGKPTILKELQNVDESVEKLYPMIQDGVGEIETRNFEGYVMELKSKGERLSHGLDLLLEEVDSFFKMILSGRDVLLCNLRSSDSISVGENVD